MKQDRIVSLTPAAVLVVVVIGALGIATAAFGAVHVAAHTWERVKTRPKDRTIRVTGSASRRIVSDLIEWKARIETHDVDRVAAYRTLRDHAASAVAYLEEQGIAADEISLSSVISREEIDTEYVGTGENRIERQVSRGWLTYQTISVRSRDVTRVERTSREITQLLERGIQIDSNPPEYIYTRLGEVKISMLAEAAANARERAVNIIEAGGGGGLGRLLDADMGVINVNPANSTATSWEGNNDKTSLEKDIITISHLTFQLQ